MSSSNARARYLKARTNLRSAEEAEDVAARATDGVSDELAVARTGVKYARREFASAGQAYAQATKERLVATDPAFAHLARNAEDAAAAAQAAHKLVRAIRDVYHAASAARPEGFRESAGGVRTGLEEGAQAYSRITSRFFRLHGEALAELKADLATLVELATDSEGRMQMHLEEHATRFETADGRSEVA